MAARNQKPPECHVIEEFEEMGHRGSRTVLRVVSWNDDPQRFFERRELYVDFAGGPEQLGKCKGFAAATFAQVLKHAPRIQELLAIGAKEAKR